MGKLVEFSEGNYGARINSIKIKNGDYVRVCFAGEIYKNQVLGIAEVNEMKEIIYFVNYSEEVCVGREVGCINRKETYVPNEFGEHQDVEARRK